jgi:hypothetical protein
MQGKKQAGANMYRYKKCYEREEIHYHTTSDNSYDSVTRKIEEIDEIFKEMDKAPYIKKTSYTKVIGYLKK